MKDFEKQELDQFMNDKKMLLWEYCNYVWFLRDKKLTDEAFKISHEINCYIPANSQHYWDQIDIRLYKNHRDKLRKYYSMDN